MTDDNKFAPRENGFNGAVEVLTAPPRVPVFELSPREPHLYDYLLILRKHQSDRTSNRQRNEDRIFEDLLYLRRGKRL